MAILKCKMCGGNLDIQDNTYVAECDFCGTRQTVPSADDEKKINLFTRANKLRTVCEFDKAYGIFESIISEFPKEAEAYWGLVLCKYGIEYVDDPKTGNKIPTCHRSSFESLLDDENYKQTIKNADSVARELYKSEAEAIEKIRKGIVEISSKEEPYDIFICYKETDKNGERTKDSVLAQEIYKELNSEGYKVFFARITLEDKLGVKYEPYIFSALHSSKVMLVVSTTAEHVEAVWVKNEWSRYLKLIANGEKKTLIPCYRGMDAYDLPIEFSDLQGQDMGKVGAIQDLVRGITKIIPKNKPEIIQQVTMNAPSTQQSIAPLVKRAYGFLQSGEVAKANEYFDKILDQDPENQEVLIGTVLIELKLNNLPSLENGTTFFHNTKAYRNIKGVCSNLSYYESLLEKIKINNYKALEKSIANGDFSIADSYIDNLLTYEDANDKLAVYSFLVENKVKSIDELVYLEKAIVDLPNLNELMEFVSEETKGKINNTIEIQRKNVYEALEKAFTNKEYEKVSPLVKKAVRFGEDEKPYLYDFLAKHKVQLPMELSTSYESFLKDNTYVSLIAHASEETKRQINYVVVKQKENLEKSINDSFESKAYEEAYKKCNLYYSFEDFKNERINLVNLFASLKISSYKEIETYPIIFTDTEEYKLFISSCSEDAEKQLQASIDRQAEYLKEKNLQQIEIFENQMQEALERGEFKKAISIANECLNIDFKNEKAQIVMFLVGKNAKNIEEALKLNPNLTEERDYKTLISNISGKNKKQFSEAILKINSLNKKKKKIKKIAIISSIIGVVLQAVCHFIYKDAPFPFIIGIIRFIKW